MDSRNRGRGREGLVVPGKEPGSRSAEVCAFAETDSKCLECSPKIGQPHKIEIAACGWARVMDGLLLHKQVHETRTIRRSVDSVCRRTVWDVASSGCSFGSRRGFAASRESRRLSRERTLGARIQMDIVGCHQ